MDTALLHAVNGLAFHHDGLEDPVTLYEFASLLLFLALVVVLVASGVVRGRAGVAAGLGAVLALACGQVVSRLVDRPRPFVADPHRVHLFARHVADPSFPSDHATAAFAIATAVLLRNRRVGAVVLALAALLAVGRVAIGVHYPSDVLAGAALGAGASVALYARVARTRIDALADAVTLALRRLGAGARTSS